MIDKRYQAFIISAGLQTQTECRTVHHVLMNLGFFAWAMDLRTPSTTALARRQIDECDYVIVLLGSYYGDQSASGISYMHLEYIYAVAKNKPIIVFMQEPTDKAANDQYTTLKFDEFKKQLQDKVEHLFVYKSVHDLEVKVRTHMSELVRSFPAAGWIRPHQIQILVDEITMLKSQVNQLQTQLGRPKISKELQQPIIYPNELYCFHYVVQAYQDGSVHELRSQRTLSWLEILTVLGPTFKTPMSEEHFLKSMNTYLAKSSLSDVRRQLPNTMTVSRPHIERSALQTIKMRMQQNEWIMPYAHDARHGLTWQLTTKAVELLLVDHAKH